jgi:hypothetical protein
MPAEIRLSDGTTLTDNDPNVREDDILKKLGGPFGPGGSLAVNTADGTYRVLPAHIVYVRNV